MLRSVRFCTFAAIVITTATAATAHAGFPVGLPALEVDVGETAPLEHTVTGVATDFLIGMNLASMMPRPISIDIGAGFIDSTRSLLEPIALGRSDGATIMSSQSSLSLNGAYLSFGHTIADRHHWRTWVTGRAELMHGELDGTGLTAFGVAARLQTELYLPVRYSEGPTTRDHSAFAFGTFAIGAYVEASHRTLPSELGPDGVTIGISLRLPFLAASYMTVQNGSG